MAHPAQEMRTTRQQAKKLQAEGSGHELLDPSNYNQPNSRNATRNRAVTNSDAIGVESDPPNMTVAKKILARKREDGFTKWKMWLNRKEKITKMLESRHDVISSLLTKPSSQGINDDMKDYNMTIQEGLHVFRPSVGVLNDFESFLLRAEHMAGRGTGVVKVILPKELLLPPDNTNEFVNHRTKSHGQKALTPSMENLPVVKYLTKLDLRTSDIEHLPIYDVRMMGGLRQSASTCSEDVRSHRRSVLELHGKAENYPGDIFSEVKFADGREEEKMFEGGAQSSTDRYYSADVEASNQSRSALNCGKVYMKEFHAYGFYGAQTDRDAIHQPKLQIAGAFGSSFGLHMTSFGAYSLNVLHSGAPKYWTVIPPADHEKIEYVLQSDAEDASLRGKKLEFVRLTNVELAYSSKGWIPYADIPPRCDQFLNHQPFYIPKGALKVHKIEFIQLVQYAGELIIRFPFSYSQGYSCGPSIAEEVGYTNEWSEALNQEGLYLHCHAACTGPKFPVHLEAFPTAAASDARRREKTISPMPLDHFIKRANSVTADLTMAMKNSVIGEETSTLENKNNKETKNKERSEEDPSNKRETQEAKKKRRRLVKASDLPGYGFQLQAMNEKGQTWRDLEP